MRLILILALGCTWLALPASADYHDYDEYDEGDGSGEYDDDYTEPTYDDPVAGAVQSYDCAQWVQGQCVPFETQGQGIRE